jgi:diguanylate cyclase (GGDEF)-like protein
MAYLIPTVDSWGLALSLVLGFLTIYVLFDLSRRVHCAERGIAYLWWIGGAVVSGTGLWAMHFLAMYSRVLPIPIGYAVPMTLVSWVCAVGAAAIALSIAARHSLNRSGLIASTAILGIVLGITHHTGMAAIELAPGVIWDAPLAAAAALFSLALAAAAMVAIQRLCRTSGWKAGIAQGVVAIGIGIGFTAMNWLAVAAANVPENAMCFSALALDGTHVRDLTVIAVPLLLICTLLCSIVYGAVDQRRSLLAGSLEHVNARLDSANDELRQRAMLDPLTGLPNRLLFEDRLAQALLRSERAKKSVRGLRERIGVLFIDIDGFKPVNDSFGHAAGDEVIRQVAQRLRAEARNEDTVSRVGGDQFLVLMEGASSGNDCVVLATRIGEAIKVPFRIVDRKILISVSIGVVVYPDHGESTKLLAQADSAMQAAKRAGRGTYALFESHMHENAADQLDLINDLRQAIELKQLELQYQPKIDGKRHLICGVEALLRWHHPRRGSISPALFIPIAERFGFINSLGAWVIEEACRQMSEWSKDSLQMRVAINLSVHQLREPDLVGRIESALARHGVRSSNLLCEITESVAMQDIAATQRTLDGLGKIGVYLSIDDFGTGYSSLSYLRQLPARQLKIDRTFINDLDTSDDAKAVVDGVVRLAHALGLRVVAEGVETASQRDILLRLGCDELQGYFFAHPMSATRLLAWTHGNKPKGTVDFAQSLVRPSIAA